MSTGQMLGSWGRVEILPGVLTVTLGYGGTFPGPSLAFRVSC
jgi:hypothetical protein